MSTGSSIRRRRTLFPCGPVCCVISVMPIIWRARRSASSASAPTFTPLPLPRAAGGDLGLHAAPAAEASRDRPRLLGAEGDVPLRDLDAEALQDLFGLVLVDFHRHDPIARGPSYIASVPDRVKPLF